MFCIMISMTFSCFQQNDANVVAEKLVIYRKEQSDNVKQLIAQFAMCRSNGDDTGATLAARKLAVLRSIEAVPTLIEHLEFSPKFTRLKTRFYTLSELYPCVYALGKIGGESCHNAILHRIVTTRDADSIKHARKVLKISLGCDGAISLVNGWATREKDAAVIERLQTLAESIEKNERGVNLDN